jgi:hypothetical protein
MIRIAVALAVFAGAVEAQSVKLRGDEIAILLSGNTAVGIWEGHAYRQYFDADGTTIYAQDGGTSLRGTWRVDGDEYQSIGIIDEDWEGRFVMEYGGQWFWVSKTVPPTPFEVIEGNTLVAE